MRVYVLLTELRRLAMLGYAMVILHTWHFLKHLPFTFTLPCVWLCTVYRPWLQTVKTINF